MRELDLTARQLVIPKFHGEKLVDIPDEQLAECLVCTFPSEGGKKGHELTLWGMYSL